MEFEIRNDAPPVSLSDMMLVDLEDDQSPSNCWRRARERQARALANYRRALRNKGVK